MHLSTREDLATLDLLAPLTDDAADLLNPAHVKLTGQGATAVRHLQDFVPKGERQPLLGQLVKVYRNLNRPAYFSLMCATGPDRGLVLGYARAVHIEEVSFTVSHKSRERALGQRRRNVHAFAVGRLVATDITPPPIVESSWNRVTYQPFRAGHFFDRALPDTPIDTAREAWLFGADAFCPSAT